MKEEEIRKAVREGYGQIARGPGSCCSPADTCCGPANPCCGGTDLAQDIGRSIGYSDEELGSAPEGANLGLGCGNPVALASLREGEVVLDLGAGAGFDCFLAANRVGQGGRVIGVDMTPEMIERARGIGAREGYDNVEFRLGEIENLPAADSSVDVVISNCVINLSPHKDRVFGEAFRVLKPGGRLMVSDIVLLRELPDSIRESVQAYVGCLSGAIMKDAYIEAVRRAGFQDVTVVDETCFPIELAANDPTAAAIMKESSVTPEALKGVGDSVLSVKVHAAKPVPVREPG
jgi:arsenite methyltransferase